MKRRATDPRRSPSRRRRAATLALLAAPRPDRLRPRVLPGVGQPGRLRGDLREEPRPALPDRRLLDRPALDVAVRRPLRPRLPPGPARRLRHPGPLAGPPVVDQPPDRPGRGDRLPGDARAVPVRAHGRPDRHGRQRGASAPYGASDDRARTPTCRPRPRRPARPVRHPAERRSGRRPAQHAAPSPATPAPARCRTSAPRSTPGPTSVSPRGPRDRPRRPADPRGRIPRRPRATGRPPSPAPTRPATPAGVAAGPGPGPDDPGRPRPAPRRSRPGTRASAGPPLQAPARPPRRPARPRRPPGPCRSSTRPRSDDPKTDPLRTPASPATTARARCRTSRRPINPRPDLANAGNREVEAKGAELEGLLGTGSIDFIEAEAIGLPARRQALQDQHGPVADARLDQRPRLPVPARAALPGRPPRDAPAVRLHARSSSPGSRRSPPRSGPARRAAGVGSGLSPVINPSNAFNYRTRATGLGQQSLLNIGTVAAVGRSFDNGGQGPRRVRQPARLQLHRRQPAAADGPDRTCRSRRSSRSSAAAAGPSRSRG